MPEPTKGPRAEYPAAAVGAAIRDALARSTTSGRATTKRHPAEVTADRLGDQVIDWAEKFTGEERDFVGVIIQALHEIAEGKR